jgi:DNA-binding transcriptional MocR family regulator
MEVISLDGEAPGSDLLPLEELADCAGDALGREGQTLLSYGTGAGYTPLRELIGEWFGVAPQRVVLTNGRLQGVGLLAERLVRGRNVITESPGDDRSDHALLAAGGVLVPVGLDAEGLRADELRQLLIQYTRPVLVSVTPSFENPTGETMSQARRSALLELVEEQNRIQTERIFVLEDDSYALTRFEGERLPALFDLSGGTTVYSSSFSTTVAPGLRVGFFILPPELAAALTATANATYISPALPAQATVYEFIRRGSLAAHLAGLCAALRERRDAMDVALAEHFAGASWQAPEGGFFVWLQLPPGVNGRAVLARADGVTAVAGTRFGWTANALRLSFCAAAPDEIAEGIARLAAAMP